jgi:hypothetical protein
MNLEDFMTSPKASPERERFNRIRVSLAAYAYEYANHSIMSDGDFDKLALTINPDISTIEDYHTDPIQIKRYKVLDEFFKKEFQPDTGQWIYKHPELDKIATLYKKLYEKKKG